MKFENVLADVNGFGRFQIMIIAISFIGRFTLPCHFMLNNFIAAVPSHRCDISALDDGGVFKNLSETERLVVGIPLQDDGTPSSCVMFAEPQYHLLSDSFNTTELPIAPCRNGWVYDNSTFKSTITSQVCLFGYENNNKWWEENIFYYFMNIYDANDWLILILFGQHRRPGWLWP